MPKSQKENFFVEKLIEVLSAVSRVSKLNEDNADKNVSLK